MPDIYIDHSPDPAGEADAFSITADHWRSRSSAPPRTSRANGS